MDNENKKVYWTYDPETYECNGVDEYEVQPANSTDVPPHTQHIPYWDPETETWYDPESPEEKIKEQIDNLTTELLQQSEIIRELRELNDTLIKGQLATFGELKEDTEETQEKGDKEQ